MGIRDLMDRLQVLHEEAKPIIARADAGEDVSDADLERLKTLRREMDETKAQLRADRQYIQKHGRSRPDPDVLATPTALGPFPGGAGTPADFDNVRRVAQRLPFQGRRCSELFGQAAVRSEGGFASEESFWRTLHSGQHHPALHAAMSEGVGADGGFAVPTEYAVDWLDASLEDEIVRPRARVEPMKYETKKVGTFDGSDSSSGAPYGLEPIWVAENDTLGEDKGQMRLVQLTANKIALLVPASNEVLADGGSTFAGMLGGAMARSIGWGLDSAFISGDGAGKPLGALNAASTIEVAKEGGQAADTIQYENLTTMFSRLHPASVKNSVWVCSSTTIPQLLGLSISVGTGGSHFPVLSETDGTFRMLSRPVIFTEKCPPLGDAGDVMLVDWSQYIVGLRLDVSVDRSRHAGFTKDQTFYRGIVRADGAPAWAEAYSPLNGSTLSWCVTIEDRT